VAHGFRRHSLYGGEEAPDLARRVLPRKKPTERRRTSTFCDILNLEPRPRCARPFPHLLRPAKAILEGPLYEGEEPCLRLLRKEVGNDKPHCVWLFALRKKEPQNHRKPL
jgi:hypothetical protein